MSVSVPAFTNACIAPSRSASTVYLVGVPVTNEGRLEAYTVDLSNVDAPKATFVNNRTSSSWSSSAPKGCYSYPGNQADANGPVLVSQFGPKSYFTNIYPNGTIDFASYFNLVGFISPKLFSLTGAVGNLDWFTAYANMTFPTTNSPWCGLRINATETINSQQDAVISLYPSSNPLLSVGTFVATSNTPAQGYHTVFDASGNSGTIYTTLASATPIVTSQDRVLSLTSPQQVDMGGVTLTTNAISITMIGVGYILDRASDGSTVMYSISPGRSVKLERVAISGNVPPYSPSMVATALNSQIVVYGSSTGSIATATFNIYDTVTGAWNGPGLVKPPAPAPSSSGSSPRPTSEPSSEGSKSNAAAIGGGVAAVVVILLLVAFIVYKRRKPKTNAAAAAVAAGAGGSQPAHGTNVYNDAGKTNNPPPMQQNYQPQQQQQQQPTYNPHHSYIPPTPLGKDAFGPTSPIQQHQQSPVQQYQQSPVIFQSQQYNANQGQHQQNYSYIPPTLGGVTPQQQQQPSPTIFQPQTSGNSPAYSQPIYTSGPGTTGPIQPTYPPINQDHGSSTGSPQYRQQAQGQGYAP
ncbi:hypothetical protein BGZ70_008603 [Mortierella alpina]|uniref:Transmembrane protein n=1 Tax=Mortierella alpina TaxID=64518 RepID=A0A9P6J3L8_MORAP|nr:hypothetical protein BGZ70_008603 [Mortierella alpina]